jgi:hypothetical protein
MLHMIFLMPITCTRSTEAKHLYISWHVIIESAIAWE